MAKQVRLLAFLALGFFSPSVAGSDVCNVETGGSCKFFNCKSDRHSVCVSGSCMCPPGKCTNADGKCKRQNLKATCDKEAFDYYHMSEKACTFDKNSGSGMPAAPDGSSYYGAASVSDAAAVTELKNVVGISWYAGEHGVVSIGLTTDPTDDRDFANGVYLKQDAVGRYAGPSTGRYTADDVLNMTIACGAQTVDFYKNDVKFVSQESPTTAFPQSVYAKIWITDYGKSLKVKEVAVLQNCVWGLWSDWSTCSVTCGGGSQTRARAIALPAKNCGTPCVGETMDTQKCSTGIEGHCPIDCVWGDWSKWGECSATSGGGQKSRTREKTTTEAYGGSCSGEVSDTNGCGMVAPLCTDCQWGEWEAWSECSKKCGAGDKKRNREITQHSTFGGQVCNAHSQEMAGCSQGECVETDCALADWSDWGECTASCGSGSRTQTRKMPPSTGAPCVGPLARTSDCNVAPCNLVGSWKVADGAALNEASLVFTKPTGADTFTHAGTSFSASIESIAVMNLGAGSIRFGLTSDPHDDESFAHGAFKELTDVSKSPTTISIENDFIVYENGEKTDDLGEAKERRMYAKIFIKETSAVAEVVFEKKHVVKATLAAPTVADAAGAVIQQPLPQFFAKDRRLADATCSTDTGGSCGWFACKAQRHSVCVSSECVCPPGKCTSAEGICKTQHLTATCSHSIEWEYYHMSETQSGGGHCDFVKDSGSGMPAASDGSNYYAQAAVSDAAAWSLTSDVVGISWYAGEHGVASIGLTTDPTDDRDFSHGVYLKQDDVGRFAGPMTGHYKADDIFNMTIACGASTVDFYKNDVKIVSQDSPTSTFPQSNYAKIWITDFNKAIRIKNIAVIQDCKWGDWSPWSECSVTCGSGTQTRGRIVALPAKYCGKECEGPKAQSKPCSLGIDGHCPVDCTWGAWSDYSKCSASQICIAPSAEAGSEPEPAQALLPVEASALPDDSSSAAVKAKALRPQLQAAVSARSGASDRRLEEAAVCTTDTGGSCSLFACKADRHSVCVAGDCVCPPGKCTDHEGTCKTQHLTAKCSHNLDWEYYHMSETKTDGNHCNFLKDSGSGMPAASDGSVYYAKAAVSDAAAWSLKPDVVGISWYAGERGVASIGLTTNPTDDRDFSNGVYLKQDDVGRFAGPMTGHYKADDIFTMRIACGASTVDFYKNGVKIVSQDAPTTEFPQANYAKIWITDFNKAIRIKSIDVLQDCSWSEWTPWTTCSATCGDGSQTRSRVVVLPAENCGKPCDGPKLQTRDCSLGTIGHSSGKEMTRTRVKGTDEKYGGTCKGIGSQTVSCGLTPPAPVDCAWNDWQEWDACTTTCGNGGKSRTRTIGRHSGYGGMACNGISKETASCGNEACPAVDCAFGDWSAWSACSVSCGNGIHQKTRKVAVQEANGGASCAGKTEREEECNVAKCHMISMWSSSEGAHVDEGDMIVSKKSGDDSTWAAGMTTISGDVESVAVQISGIGSIRFGLTSKADDDESFANGFYKELQAGPMARALSGCSTTIAIEGGTVVVYSDGEKTNDDLGNTSVKGMYAKIFLLETTAKAEVIYLKLHAAKPAGSLLSAFNAGSVGPSWFALSMLAVGAFVFAVFVSRFLIKSRNLSSAHEPLLTA